MRDWINFSVVVVLVGSFRTTGPLLTFKDFGLLLQAILMEKQPYQAQHPQYHRLHTAAFKTGWRNGLHPCQLCTIGATSQFI